uniref:Ribonuclease H-like domain-containing protein n=1 Tax=Tanacetum cinerariifolium TaxID=118510 RepID=A0A6L2NW37_TANCI|nr:ribonuclease H-like domain-containing protein [Tanacetum cinerariifolium]
MLNGGVEMISLYMRCSTKESRWSEDGNVLHEMLNGGVEMVSLYMRCSMKESRWSQDGIVVYEMFNERVEMVSLFNKRSQDGIVVHEMFNERVEMVSLYMRCSVEELTWTESTMHIIGPIALATATHGPIYPFAQYLADDTLSHYKARLIANGSTRLKDIDVDETFSPVVKPDISYAVQQVYLYMHYSREPHLLALKWILRGRVSWGCQCYSETFWLRNLLCDLHTPLSSAMLVSRDNVSAVYLFSNSVQHQRLPSSLFDEFHTSLYIRCPLTQTAGECSSIFCNGLKPRF